MGLPGYIDVLAAGAGMLLLLSMLNEALLEMLKSVCDRRWITAMFGSRPSKIGISQRFWQQAKLRVIEDTALYLQKHANELLPANCRQGRLCTHRLMEILISSRMTRLPAEGAANITEEQIATALNGLVIVGRFGLEGTPQATDGMAMAYAERRWEILKPVVSAVISSRMQFERKAYQNRLRIYAFAMGLLLSTSLSLTGQFSLLSYITTVNSTPDACRAAAYFGAQGNAANLQRLAQQGPGERPVAAQAADIAGMLDAVSKASGMGVATPQWSFKGCKTVQCHAIALLDVILLAVLLAFGSEHWHGILDALISSRRRLAPGMG